MLYWQSPLQLTPVRVTGILLTNPLDAEHVCGSVMPAQALERTVSSALRAISIEVSSLSDAFVRLYLTIFAYFPVVLPCGVLCIP
jgi:hypothetical protein